MSHLRVVSDNGETLNIGPIGLNDELAALDTEGAATVVTITLGDGFSQIRVLGEQMSLYSLMGVFEAAKFEMMSELIEEQ